jgi:hypothetical protein
MDRPSSSNGKRAPLRRPISFIPHPDITLRDPALPTPTIDKGARDRIGRELRAMYAEFARQPLPPRLLDLLDRIADPKERS